MGTFMFGRHLGGCDTQDSRIFYLALLFAYTTTDSSPTLWRRYRSSISLMGVFGGLTCIMAVVDGVAAAGLLGYTRSNWRGVRLTVAIDEFGWGRRRRFILRWGLQVVGLCGGHFCGVEEMEA